MFYTRIMVLIYCEQMQDWIVKKMSSSNEGNNDSFVDIKNVKVMRQAFPSAPSLASNLKPRQELDCRKSSRERQSDIGQGGGQEAQESEQKALRQVLDWQPPTKARHVPCRLILTARVNQNQDTSGEPADTHSSHSPTTPGLFRVQLSPS